MSEQTSQASFKENFATLKRISEQMRNQQDPDIDTLIPQVDEATKAYGVCQGRIEQVRAMLAERMPQAAE